LGNDVQAIVQFQRREKTGEFTINLLRVKSDQIAPRLYGGYAEAGGARLSYVLWYVYELRLYPASDWWWPPDESSLRNAADMTLCNGVHWLENAAAPKPWEMPAYRSQEWVQAAQAMLGRDLSAWGFAWVQQTLTGDVPYLYAVRSRASAYDIVELQPAYSLDPAEFTFDVRLQRAASPDPLSGGGPRVSLAQLRRAVAGDAAAPAEAVLAEAKALLWRYTDRAELDKQLRDVVGCLQQFGLGWFDRVGSET
jgi:hypothetical protein